MSDVAILQVQLPLHNNYNMVASHRKRDENNLISSTISHGFPIPVHDKQNDIIQGVGSQNDVATNSNVERAPKGETVRAVGF